MRVLTTDFFSALRDSLALDIANLRILAYVINFQFYKKFYRSSAIFHRILQLHKNGTSVKVILDSSPAHSQNHRANLFAFSRLNENGIHVRMQAHTKPQHAKVIIIDDKILFVGSHNLTEGSLTNPFEISFAFTDPGLVKSFREYFDALWSNEYTIPWERRQWPKSKGKMSRSKMFTSSRLVIPSPMASSTEPH